MRISDWSSDVCSSDLVSWKRGRPSNRAFKAELRDQVLGLVREHYHDFGPTLAVEYLAERHPITISHETLRKWMIKEGLWKDRAARSPRPSPPRRPEERRGGKEWVSTCRSRGARYPKKKQ